MQSPNCIFCKIISKQIPSKIIQQTDDILVIEDIAPKAPLHYLIIPKQHITDIQSLSDTDAKLAGKLLMMARNLSKELDDIDFKLVVNSGPQAGQHVMHLHFHFLAGEQMGEI